MNLVLNIRYRPLCCERSCTKSTELSAWMAGILSGSTDEVLSLLLFLTADTPTCGYKT